VAAAPSTTPAGAAISTTPTDRSLRIRDPVRNFFRSHIDSDNCLPQVDRIEEFCSGASLGGLLDNERTHKRAAVATVDEGSFFGDVYHRRGPAAPVPVNARGLYFLLKDPVCFLPCRTEMLTTDYRHDFLPSSHSSNPR
jgi:hypothetical protein